MQLTYQLALLAFLAGGQTAFGAAINLIHASRPDAGLPDSTASVRAALAARATTSAPPAGQTGNAISILLHALPSSVASSIQSEWRSESSHPRSTSSVRKSRTTTSARSSTSSSSSSSPSSSSPMRSSTSSARLSSTRTSVSSTTHTITSTISSGTSTTPASTSPTSQSVTVSSSSSTEPVKSSTTTSASSSSSSGLTVGAIIGIVCGFAGIIAAATISGAALYIRRKRRQIEANGGRRGSDDIFPRLAWLYDPKRPRSRGGKDVSRASDDDVQPSSDNQPPTLQPGPRQHTPDVVNVSPASSRQMSQLHSPASSLAPHRVPSERVQMAYAPSSSQPQRDGNWPSNNRQMQRMI